MMNYFDNCVNLEILKNLCSNEIILFSFTNKCNFAFVNSNGYLFRWKIQQYQRQLKNCARNDQSVNGSPTLNYSYLYFLERFNDSIRRSKNTIKCGEELYSRYNQLEDEVQVFNFEHCQINSFKVNMKPTDQQLTKCLDKPVLIESYFRDYLFLSSEKGSVCVLNPYCKDPLYNSNIMDPSINLEVIPPLRMPVAQISFGAEHLCMLNFDGQVYTFGNGLFGQLGHGESFYENELKRVEGELEGKQCIAVQCGPYYTSVITAFGQLYTFGLEQGLNDGLLMDTYVPTLVKMETKVVMAACGDSHMAVIDEFGQLWTFGALDSVSLGTNAPNSNHHNRLPKPVPRLSNVVQVNCGDFHTVVVQQDGFAYSFGWNEDGQCCHPSNVDTAFPKKITQLGKVSEVSCFGNRTLLLCESGEVRWFGERANEAVL